MERGDVVLIAPGYRESAKSPIRTGIDYQNLSLNMEKDLHKINEAIDNDVIILRPLSVV